MPEKSELGNRLKKPDLDEVRIILTEQILKGYYSNVLLRFVLGRRSKEAAEPLPGE